MKRSYRLFLLYRNFHFFNAVLGESQALACVNLKRLAPPYDLVVKLLYGCGLRLFECLRLRVHCMNFDAGILTVHDGKGQKDRTVPLPETILPELRGHLESLKENYTHEEEFIEEG